MHLSALQRYILQTTVLIGRKKVSRQIFHRFYHSAATPSRTLQINAITKSLERLIAKKLVIGFGELTACKWFIKEIQLTALGRNLAKDLLGQQITLPLKK
jgi:hypothetical protein